MGMSKDNRTENRERLRAAFLERPRSREVMEARLRGETLPAIGERLGVSRQRVAQISWDAERLGLLTARVHIPWTEVVREFEAGRSREDIAQARRIPLCYLSRLRREAPDDASGRWGRARGFAWPLTTAQFAAAMWGQASTSRASSLLSLWTRQRRLERVAPGLYDLPREHREAPPQLQIGEEVAERIATLLQGGVRRADIARQLDLTPRTVKAEADRLQAGA